jgi:Lipid A 3-O-deacylase (PagL)
MRAQTSGDLPSDLLRHPGWNCGVQVSGGTTLVQVSSPSFITANRNISSFAASFHVGRVLTHEHGRGWIRGTFEWDFNVIPVEIFWVLGYHYAGGFEAFGPRWNFTHNRHRVVPFAGLTGGMLFSSHNFPPGPTYQTNFTIGVDAGAHLFVRRRRSIDVIGRLYHLSNAFLGPSNPGIPVGLQLTLGYVWY